MIPHHEPLVLMRRGLAHQSDERVASTELAAFLACDLARGFDLENTHPMRIAVLSRPDCHWLVWSFHHILLDGWSIGLVLDQVRALYNDPATQPGTCHYGDYQRWLVKRDRQAALDYWQTHLHGFDGAGLLTACSEATTGSRHACHQIDVPVDASTTAKLRALAQSQRASMHHLLLCAWGVVVGRYLDWRDVIIPTVLAGRPAEVEGAEHLVGLLINTVPMRVTWQENDVFITLLQQVRAQALAAGTHQYLSLADIQAVSGALPIDHVLLLQGLPHQDALGARWGDATVGAVEFRENTPYALEVSITPHESSIAITVRGHCDPVWMQELANSMHRLLDAVAHHPLQPIDGIDLLDAAQRQRVLDWGDGGPVAAHRNVLDAFDAQLERTPDACAVVGDGFSLSYRQLDCHANRLAHALQAAGPLPADSLVALISNRDAGLVAGLLAILRAGAAYVPIDPDFPSDRIRLMLTASGCRHLLVAPDLIASLPSLPDVVLVRLDEAPTMPDTRAQRIAQADDLAYVMFTSGSTGTPKGAMLTHRNVASFFASLSHVFGFAAGDRMLGVTTISFDIAGLELLGALTCGMTVVLASANQARDPLLLAALIEREQVDTMQMTPTRLRLLQESAPSALSGVRTLLVGGEALPQTMADQLLSMPHLRVFNVYGPTETTIWSAFWPLASGPVSLGRALPGERLLLLDARHTLQPPGAVGEIAIAGAGVARGYLNDPARTAERFISLPGIDGPVYLTGDLGRWHADGRLEYLGRRDDQVKIRGMRIEIGEIEHHLRQLPGIQNAAAAIQKNAHGEAEIVAYLVLRPEKLEESGKDCDVSALRARLARHLPPAMLPTHFMYLPELPQTPNGKTDRRSLPDPRPALSPPRAAPARDAATPVEATITRIFCDVLDQSIGPDDDFFFAGGHSLKAIQAIGRINRELSASYTLRDLYRMPSAARLASIDTHPLAPPTRAPEQPDYPLSQAQQALWVLDQMQPGYAGYNVPGAYLLQGPLVLPAFTQAWQTLFDRHESLRTVFRTVRGQPRQFILETMPVAIEHATPADVAAYIAEFTGRPFDLCHGPLLRMALIALDAQRQILVLVTHHIISDGWSDTLLANELAIAYQAALAGRSPAAALPAPPPWRYRDFALWQERLLAAPAAQRHRDYWRERLLDLPLLALPTDHPRANILSRRGARIEMRLEKVEAAAWLQAVPAPHRYATLVAATLMLLHHESHQTDLVLGLPIANRDRPEWQDQVGLHLNMLPLRQRLRLDASLEQLRLDCSQSIVEAMEHADYPLARLVDELGIHATPGRHPVFDAMLIYHQHPTPVLQLEGVSVTAYDPQSYTSRFDLDFEVWTHDEGVYGLIEYDTGLFTPERMQRLVAHWQALLVAYAQKPAALLCEFYRPHPATGQNRESFLAKSLMLDEEF